jgi:hypothetical protein
MLDYLDNPPPGDEKFAEIMQALIIATIGTRPATIENSEFVGHLDRKSKKFLFKLVKSNEKDPDMVFTIMERAFFTAVDYNFIKMSLNLRNKCSAPGSPDTRLMFTRPV